MKTTKLWQKKVSVNEQVEKFTVGKDRKFDLYIAVHDVKASKAHAKMLHQIGLLTAEELYLLNDGLSELNQLIEQGKFYIHDHIEDVHSQIEFFLTEKCGEAGKKIHTGRSRNDQVLTAIKLFVKEELQVMKNKIESLQQVFRSKSVEFSGVFMPGYTHFQAAMPSDFGWWLGAYADSLEDDLLLLEAAVKIADKNPLGSAAGYGTTIPVDKELTAKECGFSSVNENPLYAQMTRGKTEKQAAWALAAVAATLSKFSYDCCLFMCNNFGFISFPEELTTGSSIMPHKRNPDVFELIRAKCNVIQAKPNELTLLCNNLPHGYHRDMQLTKEIMFPLFGELQACLEMTELMVSHMEINPGLILDAQYKDVFSVEKVNKLVMDGVPFREAYRMVGES